MNLPTRTPLRVRHPLRRRLVQVSRIEQISPLMRRIIFSGKDLEGFVTAAADDHVKLFFPLPGRDQPTFPEIGPDGRLIPDPNIIARDYTPRRFDPQKHELTIEFVLHGEGPAASWAAQAQPGQWLGIGGPRGSFLVPEDYAAYLLIGDETALPAIARRLEEAAPGTNITAIIEIANAREERPLPTRADAKILWCHRNEAPADDSTILLDALKNFALPSKDTHVWIATEIETARRLRDYLETEEALPHAQIRSAGYWRHGAAKGDGGIGN
ncbi:siderophore-interacting protein [Kozakia baliensis]|uniref:siderophore-interacting protein n=1 Tax=Kozakia baliensis TaxID=153496 RepID=UPI0004957434|nr:siderophore-interacting protein [Kozakia baliensis]